MKKILFVDDDALIARLYSHKLAEEGFEVSVAEDGLVAMKRLMEFRPDLVVLDLLMPRMSGPDVIKFIRERPELKSTRVIVFSNSFLSELVEKVEAAGVDGTLVKSSVTPAQLIHRIRELLDSPAPAAEAPVAPAAGPAAPAKPAVARESEAQFQQRVQKEFVERTPTIIATLRQICREFLAGENVRAQLPRLETLTRKVGFLTQMTVLGGCGQLAQLSSALEALLFQILDKPALLTESSQHTIVSTVAFLVDQLEGVTPNPAAGAVAFEVFVVDDDAVSNRAVVHALARAQLHATSVSDPLTALQRLKELRCDLILLDVDMPGMSGLTLCEQLRQLPAHRHTPVVFVTSYGDFKTRARSILSGGNDIITKPVLPAELAVKALGQILKFRLNPAAAAASG